ncbi:MAG TPA: PAS domain S-box protein [Dehalococcoidia bacterium]
MSEALPIQELLDSAPDGFVVVDEQGVIVFANRTVETAFGYERNELLGQRIDILIPERLRRVHQTHREAYVHDPQVRPMGLGLDLVGRHKDGSEFPVEISLSPLPRGQQTLFTAIVRDITDRKALEQERQALAAELETERERDRIAMDLHDGIMQDIYAATLSLELALDEAEVSGQSEQGSLEHVIDQLHGVVRNIRSYIFDLRPREFSGDLVEAVTNLTNEFGQNSQIATELEIRGNASVDLPTSMAVYNIAHECLSNIQRHSRASNVSVALEFDDGTGQLEVVDNGVGFDMGADRGQSHRGVRNMYARARAVAADLEMESAPGQGTRLVIRFPTSGHRAAD